MTLDQTLRDLCAKAHSAMLRWAEAGRAKAAQPVYDDSGSLVGASFVQSVSKSDLYDLWYQFLTARRDYGAALAKATKAQSQSKLQVRLRGLVDEELAKLPKSKRLSKTELKVLTQKMAKRLSKELHEEFQKQATNIYLAGMDSVGKDVGVQLEFGGVHTKALLTVIEGQGVADAFAGWTQAVSDKFNAIIEDAYAKGRVSPGEIVSQMIDEVGWESRSRLESIARTETYKIWSEAQFNSYQEAELVRGEKFVYKLMRDLGPTKRGNPQCPICSEVIAASAKGLPLTELVDMMVKVSKKYNPKWQPQRDSTFPVLHVNCRHSLQRTGIV